MTSSSKTDIDSIWGALNEEDGASTVQSVQFMGSKYLCSTKGPAVSDAMTRTAQKRRIIQGIHDTCVLDFDNLLSQDVILSRDVANVDTAPIIDDVDTRLDDSSACFIQAVHCGFSNDSDDDSDVEDDVGGGSINNNESARMKKLLGQLKSDDRFSCAVALTKLNDITKALADKCQRLERLEFPPPYNTNNTKLDRNMSLVSDLPAPVHLQHCSDMSLTVASDARSSETATSRLAREKLQTIMDSCGKMLFKLIGDKFEKCRGLSLECLRMLLLAGVDISKHIAYLLPALFSRYCRSGYDKELEVFIFDDEMHNLYKSGAIERQDRDGHSSFKLVEPNEETRLALCRILECLIIGAVSQNILSLLDAYYSDIIIALQSTLKDPFPDVKIAACQLLVQVLRIPQWEAGAKYFATGLARAALPNLRHRKTSVVIGAIDLFEASVCVPDHAKRKGAGTSAITDLVGFREENVSVYNICHNFIMR